jgi:hypothetical protein
VPCANDVYFLDDLPQWNFPEKCLALCNHPDIRKNKALKI